MAFPLIVYKNILRGSGAILTATSTDPDFAVADIKDHKSYKGWKANLTSSPQDVDLDLGASGSQDANSIVLVNHNLVALGATLEVFADAVTIGTTQVQAPYSPVSDGVDYKAFTAPGAKRYWRFRVARGGGFSAKPFIMEMLCGLRTTLPEYVSPDLDPFSEEIPLESERSAGGHYLGAVLQGLARRGVISFGEAGIARSFYTSDLNDFIRNHALERLPFCFVLNTDDADFSKPWWLKMPDDSRARRRAVGGSFNRFALDLAFEEAMMEAA